MFNHPARVVMSGPAYQLLKKFILQATRDKMGEFLRDAAERIIVMKTVNEKVSSFI